ASVFASAVSLHDALPILSDIHPAGHAQGVEDNVDRRTVFEERHVFNRQDLGDHALITVPAGELIALADLALLGNVNSHQLVHAGAEFITVLGIEYAHSDDGALFAVGHLQRGVAHFARLFTENGPEQAFFGSQLGLALGGHLADKDVTVADFGADPDNPALIKVGEHFVADVGDIAGDLFGAELGVARIDFVFFDVDAGELIVLDDALGQDDGVFVVESLPRHERGHQVCAQCHLAVIGARAVGQRRSGFDPVAFMHQRTLVNRRALVGALEFQHPVGAVDAVVLHDVDGIGRDLFDHTGGFGGNDIAGVHGRAMFLVRSDLRAVVTPQRHRLLLLVRLHHRAVAVVVLEVWILCGAYRIILAG